jgi:hypothetical protein
MPRSETKRTGSARKRNPGTLELAAYFLQGANPLVFLSQYSYAGALRVTRLPRQVTSAACLYVVSGNARYRR